MKKLIIIALLIMAGCVPVPAQYHIAYDTIGYRSDTVKVLMLCSDTTHYTDVHCTVSNWNGHAILYNLNDYQITGVFYQYGYEVINTPGINNSNISLYVDWRGRPLHFPVSTYIDSHKKPLDKNIVVWQAINIE